MGSRNQCSHLRLINLPTHIQPDTVQSNGSKLSLFTKRNPDTGSDVQTAKLRTLSQPHTKLTENHPRSTLRAGATRLSRGDTGAGPGSADSGPRFSARGGFASQGTFGNVWRQFWWSQRWRGVRDAGVGGAEARGAVTRPTMRGAAPAPRVIWPQMAPVPELTSSGLGQGFSHTATAVQIVTEKKKIN